MISIMLKQISNVKTAHMRGFRHLLGVNLHSQRTRLGNQKYHSWNVTYMMGNY